MIQTEIVAIIMAVGGLIPLLTSVVQQPHWSARARTVIGALVATLAGVVTYVTQFGLEITSASTAVTVVVGVVLASVTAYQSIWKPSGVARSIEDATSVRSHNPEDLIPEDESIPDSW